MAGALAAILGLGGGSLIAAAGEKHRHEQQQEDQANQLQQQMYGAFLQEHPEAATLKEFQKGARKVFKGDSYDTMLPYFQVAAAEKQRDLQTKLQALQAIPGLSQFAPMIQSQIAQMQNPQSLLGPDGAPAGAAPGGGAGAQPSPAAPSPALGGPPASPPSGAVAPQAGVAPQSSPAAASGAQATPPAPGGLEDLQQQYEKFSYLAGDSSFGPELQNYAKGQMGLLKSEIENRQKQQQGGQKPPAELNAFAHAVTGRDFSALDPAKQLSMMQTFRDFKEKPAIDAYNRAENARLEAYNRTQVAQQQAQDRRDAASKRRYATSARSSVSAFNRWAEARKEIINKMPNQDDRATAMADLNAQADAEDQKWVDAAGDLPDDFTAPKAFRYDIDAAQGGLLSRLTGGALGTKPGAVHVKGASSTPAAGEGLPPDLKTENDPIVGKSTKATQAFWKGGRHYYISDGKIAGYSLE